MADAAQYVLGTAATFRRAWPRNREACMWLIGMIILLILGAALTVALGWTPRATSGPRLWDISKMVGSNAASVGTFAGFSLTSAIFAAGLDVARTSAEFTTVFGMLLVGFLILVSATWIAGSAPNSAQVENGAAQTLALGLVLMTSTLGVSVTWLALVPLMRVIGLLGLATVFVWALLIMTLMAAGWGSLVAYRLTMARARACLAIPVLGLALPALYRLVAVRQWPALWPASDAALHYAFVALGAAALLFALHMGLLVTHDSPGVQRRLRQDGHWMALVVNQAYTIVVSLIWFAVALS
jgi:hypothetical protein